MIDIFDRRGYRKANQSIMERINITDDCWEWTGAKSRAGYGTIMDQGKQLYVHRVIWEALVAPIPDGLEIDHLCRVRNCVNPDHLEPVTHAENVRRGDASALHTHCKNGHPFTDDNLYIRPNGIRRCLICKKRKDKEHYLRHRTMGDLHHED